MAYSSYRYEPQRPEMWAPLTPAELYKTLCCPQCDSTPDQHVRCYGCHVMIACSQCDPDACETHGLEPCARSGCPHRYCATCVGTDFISQQRQRVNFILVQVARSGVATQDLPLYQDAESKKYMEYRPKGYCIPCYLACTRCEKCAHFSVPILDVVMDCDNIPVCAHCKCARCPDCLLVTERMVNESGRFSGCTNCMIICDATRFALDPQRRLIHGS